MKLLRLGVLLDGLNFGNNDSADVAALVENFVFNLGGGQGELMNKLIDVKTRKVNEIFDPVN